MPWQTVEVYRPSFDVEVTERVKLHATPQLSLVQGRYNTEEAYALIEDQLGPALEAGGCSLEAPPRLGSADDAFDSPVETVVAQLDSSALAPGRHILYLRSQDNAGNWGPVSAAFFTVPAQPATEWQFLPSILGQ